MSISPIRKDISIFADIKLIIYLKLIGFNKWILTDEKFYLKDQISYVEGICSISDIIFIRFENFAEDIKKLELILGKQQWNFNNPSQDYRRQYSEQSKEHIEKYFKRDIDMFGYSFEKNL